MTPDATRVLVTSSFARPVEGTEPELSASGRVRDILAAVVTGQVSGLAMLVVMMTVAVLRGGAALDPLRSVGSILYMSPTVQPGVPPLLLGFLVHQLGFSLFWSLLYAALVRFADRRHVWNVIAIGLGGVWGAAALGPLVGMASQVVDVLIGMKLFAAGQAWTHTFTGLWSWVYHLAFGLGLAAFPWVRRTLFGQRGGSPSR